MTEQGSGRRRRERAGRAGLPALATTTVTTQSADHTRVSGFPGGHTTLLVTALVTHALVGYTLGQLAAGRPWTGALAGVVADVDLLVPRTVGWPLSHRSVTHTALAALVVAGLVWLGWRRRDVVVAAGLGYGSHVLVDLTTAHGVALAYPLSARKLTLVGGGHAPATTVATWAVCLSVLALDRRLHADAGPGDWRRLADRLR